MLKRCISFIILLVFLLLIVGCPPEQPQPLETPKSKPVQPQPAQLKPLQQLPVEETEPPITEPPVQPSTETEPPVQQPTEIKPQPVEVNEPTPQKPQAEEKQIPDANDFHSICAEILNDFVDERGMVDYKTLKRKKYLLMDVLDEFDSFDPSVYNAWPDEDKIAFWINAYNLQMLNIIIKNYPIESKRIFRIIWPPTSIRHIQGIWDEYKFIVMEEEFTLAELEKKFLREKFDEPRVFFAICLASLSSPPLRNEPYYGRILDRQLDEQVRKFLASETTFKIDRNKEIIYLSSLLQPTWFGKEFISKYGTDKKFKAQMPATRAVLSFITKYLDQQDVSYLETGNYTLKYLSYDWRLNE